MKRLEFRNQKQIDKIKADIKDIEFEEKVGIEGRDCYEMTVTKCHNCDETKIEYYTQRSYKNKTYVVCGCGAINFI